MGREHRRHAAAAEQGSEPRPRRGADCPARAILFFPGFEEERLVQEDEDAAVGLQRLFQKRPLRRLVGEPGRENLAVEADQTPAGTASFSQ